MSREIESGAQWRGAEAEALQSAFQIAAHEYGEAAVRTWEVAGEFRVRPAGERIAAQRSAREQVQLWERVLHQIIRMADSHGVEVCGK